MTDTTETPAWADWALAPWQTALRAAAWPLGIAPQALTQPINPGWSFGNVINVTDANSTAPATEQEILRHHSYGRQIGRMMDALALLIEKAPPAVKNDKRATELRKLQIQVQAIKQQQGRLRIERLRDELLELKRSDPKAWQDLVRLLR
jgi:hypothetical protein